MKSASSGDQAAPLWLSSLHAEYGQKTAHAAASLAKQAKPAAARGGTTHAPLKLLLERLRYDRLVSAVKSGSKPIRLLSERSRTSSADKFAVEYGAWMAVAGLRQHDGTQTLLQSL